MSGELSAAGLLPDPVGHFGRYGGRFMPEALVPALDELDAAYRHAQADERVLFQRGHDEQYQVGAVRPGLVHLVAGDDEVLAQQRHLDRRPYRVEVGQAPAEPARLGQYRDAP